MRKTDQQRAGFEQELKLILPQLRRFALSLTANREDGDDLLQTTVEKALNNKIPNDVDLKKWMFKICKNAWIDEVRSRQIRRKAVEKKMIHIHDKPDEQNRMEGTRMLQEAQACISRLPGQQRLVLSLVSIEGLSYKEAADMLDIPVGTVMSRLARARQTLTAELG